MVPAPFEYHRAGSLGEALEWLARHPEAKLLAGGHSLIPMLKLRLAQPPALVDVGRLAELKGIRRDGDRLLVGALSTHAEVAASREVRAAAPLLAEAAGKIADPAVRNRGTVGGNLAHADPGSDLPAVFVALGATLHLHSVAGLRRVPAADFFLDLLTTDLRPGEVIARVEVPAAAAGTGQCYLKHEHPASGYAVCGAAAVVRRSASGRCTAAALCFNGVTATPLRATAVATALVGSDFDAAALAGAIAQLAAPDPLGDVYASGEYRLHLARVHGRRALAEAWRRAA